jgi:hypothetical protein
VLTMAGSFDLLAQRIVSNLDQLSLHVKSQKYGMGFWEIRASSSPKIITVPGNETASGVALLLAHKYEPPMIVFEQINSIHPGMGRMMVAAILEGVRCYPNVFGHVRVNDLSKYLNDGRRWWEHVACNYSDFNWIITHDEETTHFSK